MMGIGAALQGNPSAAFRKMQARPSGKCKRGLQGDPSASFREDPMMGIGVALQEDPSASFKEGAEPTLGAP